MEDKTKIIINAIVEAISDSPFYKKFYTAKGGRVYYLGWVIK